MDMQPVKWWNGQSETTRRLGCGLAVCGTVVGALYLIVQTGPADRSIRLIDEGGRIAINGAASAQQFALNRLQLAVDTSPTRSLVSVPIPQPSPLAAMIKSSAPAKRVVRADAGNTKVASSAEVEHFDRCMPQCETRDPLITSNPDYAEAALPVADDAPSPVMEERAGFHPLADARNLLSKAVDAPGMMLRRSRQVIDNVARADW